MTLRRALLLILLGAIYNGALDLDLANLRLASVLGQIGVAYLFAASILIHWPDSRIVALWLVGILVGCAVLQLWVPVPGIGSGVLTPEGHINGYLDRLLLPGRLYAGSFDPEGLLCIVSSTGMTLMGVLAGMLLRDAGRAEVFKVVALALAGLAALLLGLVLAPWYPPIKSAWTTTFNLIAGGIGLLSLAGCYLVIDLWGCRGCGRFFRVIGLNSIAIYMGVRIVDFPSISAFLLAGVASLVGAFGPVILAGGTIAVEWALLWCLYRQRIVLRI